MVAVLGDGVVVRQRYIQDAAQLLRECVRVTRQQGRMQCLETRAVAPRKHKGPEQKLVDVEAFHFVVGNAQLTRQSVVVGKFHIVGREVAREVELTPNGQRIAVEFVEDGVEPQRLPDGAPVSKIREPPRRLVICSGEQLVDDAIGRCVVPIRLRSAPAAQVLKHR